MGNCCLCQDRVPVEKVTVKDDTSRMELRPEDTDSTGTPGADLVQPTLETGTGDGPHGHVPKSGWAQSENIQAEEIPTFVQPVPAQEFTINLEKSAGKPIGADMEVSCTKRCYICAVLKDGVFAEYNRTAAPEKQVKVGDYIKKVNGIEDNSLSMLDCLKKEGRFEVTIQRPLLFTIAIKKKDVQAQLGVKLVDRPSGNSLLIKEVITGPLMDWNITHPEQDVKAGDRIVAVNGKGGKVNELVEASKAGAHLQLAISRPGTTRD
jgi:C-terminal processing protease CtpA/Prc